MKMFVMKLVAGIGQQTHRLASDIFDQAVEKFL
jgi:hypothetical protein